MSTAELAAYKPPRTPQLLLGIAASAGCLVLLAHLDDAIVAFGVSKAKEHGITVEVDHTSWNGVGLTLEGVQASHRLGEVSAKSVDVKLSLADFVSGDGLDAVAVTVADADVSVTRPTTNRSSTANAGTSRPATIPAAPRLTVLNARVALADGSRRAHVEVDELRSTRRDGSWRLSGEVTTVVEGLFGPRRGQVEVTMEADGARWRAGAARVDLHEPVRVEVGERVVHATGAALRTAGASLFGVRVLDRRGTADIAEIRVDASLRSLAALSIQSFDHVQVSGVRFVPNSGTAPPESTTESRAWNQRAAGLLSTMFERAPAALSAFGERGPRRLTITDARAAFGAKSVEIERVEVLPESVSVGGRGTAKGLTVPFEARYADGHAELSAKGIDLARMHEHMAGIANGRITVREAATGFAIDGTISLTDATLDHPALAPEPVVLAAAEYRFAGTYDPSSLVPDGQREGLDAEPRGAWQTRTGTLTLGEVAVSVRPSVWGLDELPAPPMWFEVDVELEPTSLQSIVDVAPKGLFGKLAEAELSGSMSFDGRLEVPLHAPSKLHWEFAPELTHPKVKSLPHEVDVRRLLGPATFAITDPKVGYSRVVSVPAMRPSSALGQTARNVISTWRSDPESCGSFVYVPLDQMTPHLASGVMSTEDRGFFRHEGFNVGAIADSFAANIEHGRFVRGASTITMQLMKNLFLTHEKTVSRKLQEAVLVWLTESVVDVPKERLLEVYFNVIEYGPGVFGIWHASTYFFGKRPQDLTVGEVAWFINSIPGPKLYHKQFTDQKVSDSTWTRMKARVDAMYRSDFITELDLLSAKANPPSFRGLRARCGPYSSTRPAETDRDWRPMARALLERRQLGVSRSDITRIADDPWAQLTASIRGELLPVVEWDDLELARDEGEMSWWQRR